MPYFSGNLLQRNWDAITSALNSGGGPVTSDDVTNLSTVAGADVTAALNTLKAGTPPITPANAVIGVNGAATGVEAKALSVAASVATLAAVAGVNAQMLLEIAGATQPSVNVGNGDPVAIREDGSLFLRGDAGGLKFKTLWVEENGSWNPVWIGTPGVIAFAAAGGTLTPTAPMTIYQQTSGASFANLAAGVSAGQRVLITLNTGSTASINASGFNYQEDGTSLVSRATIELAWMGGDWQLISSQGVTIT